MRRSMINISVEIAGIKLRNPVMTAAGPTSRDAEALIEAARNGVGGLVAKTIGVKPAEVPRPCMATVDRGETNSLFLATINRRVVRSSRAKLILPRGLLNAELWSDIPYQQWIEREYAMAKQTGLPVIASMGYSADDLRKLGPMVEKAGVDGIEFSLHYLGVDFKPILEVAKALRESVEVPIFAKVSPHIMNLAEFAKALEAVGVDGIVAVNSLGPCLYVDVETGRPLLGGENGYGWLSGPAIKPLAIRCVAEIARTVTIPVIGCGGVTDGVDAIEHFMVGASAVQVCTGAILEGPSIYGRIVKEIMEFMRQHGYASVEDMRGKALDHLPKMPLRLKGVPPKVHAELCKSCGLCEKSCVYDAIEVKDEAEPG
ncbi:MAG: dihydroorotate dehydrogenase, partial [Aigarchaeota archaeon]|nr:dihydroorotate dehydrogenase [Aigarchaeota archaeon]